MNKLFCILLISCYSYGQELTLTPYLGGPLGLPSKGDFELYSSGANLSYDKFTIGYGHSRIFGNSIYTGVYIPKLKLNVGHTYYYNNPYRPSVNPWGSWLSVSKKITLYRRKK